MVSIGRKSGFFLHHLEDVQLAGLGYRGRMMHPTCAPSLFTTELDPPYLVVGHEHALYREVLSSSVTALRPEMAVFNISPVDLDQVVRCLQPLLVICSDLSADIERRAAAWILLHPDVEQTTIVGVRGERRSMPHPQLDELLHLIDDLLLLVTARARDELTKLAGIARIDQTEPNRDQRGL